MGVPVHCSSAPVPSQARRGSNQMPCATPRPLAPARLHPSLQCPEAGLSLSAAPLQFPCSQGDSQLWATLSCPGSFPCLTACLVLTAAESPALKLTRPEVGGLLPGSGPAPPLLWEARKAEYWAQDDCGPLWDRGPWPCLDPFIRWK